LAQSTPHLNQPPALAVIVPCYNSERTIRTCLSALINQQTDIPFEVLVVDSSEDRTPEIVQREFPGVRLIHLERRTFAGAARNVGLRATSSEFCLMIDSDCIAEPDLIQRAITRISTGEFDAVCGSLRNGTPRSLSGSVGYFIEFKEYMPSAPERRDRTAPTANIIYRRESLERSGFFDDDMQLAEDILLNWKITASGGAILFDPRMQVTHLNRTGWNTVLLYQTELGRMSAKARRRGGLPGAALLRYPALVMLMPLVRLLRAIVWVARCDKRALLMLLFLSPMYLLASGFWSFGFLSEAAAEMVESA